MRYAFVTGMGRSGTVFVTNLLKQCGQVTVRHEFIGNREYWVLSWYLPHDVYAEPYLIRAKNSIESTFDEGFFIDVNGYLQHSVPLLRKVFGASQVFHLVRDPRRVVRSLYSRRSDRSVDLIPKNRPEVEKWLDGDKFQHICWNWASTTRELLSEDTKLILFEKVISDYDYLVQNLLEPLDLPLERQLWTRLIKKKLNKTRSKFYRYLYCKVKGKEYISTSIPEYNRWPTAYKEIFEELCGDVMRQCGYE
ncbi:MAG: hypothetical protein GTO45_36620 [Candidatus Aminicenantes bacterium]|nr:hypothetical protein [Candidatus Aminicenantes bacterium]NIM84227.1 hypothetical protein [Candidatus Aminicenantes bacterium]NIN23676.1 hypothetical protein [Candidatus Aminicenantes bacterium]NIN47383.1 hypothetical protein [Candidatus Aminicenantes bacterium]NIN90311.1 hypothetical protein [Candidatus Aminicenantes bacterium]